MSDDLISIRLPEFVVDMFSSMYEGGAETISQMASDAGDALGSSMNNMLYYMKGRFDSDDNPFQGEKTINRLPVIPVESTPLFWINSILDSKQTLRAEALQQGYARELLKIENLRNLVNQVRATGSNSLTREEADQTGLVFGGEGDVPLSLVENELLRMEASSYKGFGEADKVIQSTYKDTQEALRAIQATQGLLIGVAGLKPDIIRKVMAAHLVLDTLSGVVNFRTPGRAEEYGFVQFINPYLSMIGIAATNELTRGY